MRRINAQILQYKAPGHDHIIIVDLLQAGTDYQLFTYAGPREAHKLNKTLIDIFDTLEEATSEMEILVLDFEDSGCSRLLPGTNTVIPAFDEMMQLGGPCEAQATPEHRKLSI